MSKILINTVIDKSLFYSIPELLVETIIKKALNPEPNSQDTPALFYPWPLGDTNIACSLLISSLKSWWTRILISYYFIGSCNLSGCILLGEQS